MRIALLCLLALVGSARAEHLPFRTYTTSDGLPNNRVEHGTRDARGFLWFATAGGVSRFDGEQFVTYGTADGLPADETNDVLAAHDGTIWAATDGGVAWLDPAERTVRPRFHAIAGPAALSIAEAGSQIWFGTEAGLARFERGALTPIALQPGAQPLVLAVAYDERDSSFWLGTRSGLLHRRQDGVVEHYRVRADGYTDDRVCSLLIDRAGRLWIGHVGSIVLAIPLSPGKPLTDSSRPLWELAIEHADWLHYTAHGWARRKILEDSQGTIWIGTTRDLVRFRDVAFEELSAARTGIDAAAAPCVEDGDGNVWFGSESGVHRLTRSGLVVFDRDDGLGSSIVYSFYQPPDGPVHAVIADENLEIARRDGDHFTRIKPTVPAGLRGA
ncbi:MAG TPA: two-component regulator propeller domain-containing protein, partial [Kofleriaceae bacterium]